MERAQQRHAAATATEIHQGKVELAASVPDDLNRVVHVSSDKHDCACSPKRFGYQLIEGVIAAEEKNLARFHREQMLASTLCCLRQAEGPERVGR